MKMLTEIHPLGTPKVAFLACKVEMACKVACKVIFEIKVFSCTLYVLTCSQLLFILGMHNDICMELCSHSFLATVIRNYKP